MSIIVKNSVEMSKSPLNKSKTKQVFSFPRQIRFNDKDKGFYCDSLYDVPTTRSTRAAGIGYGYRIKESKEITPGPNQYDYKLNTTEDDLAKRKGWTMGVSREKMEQNGILPVNSIKTQGPGFFMPKSTLSNVSFTMRGRPKPTELEKSRDEPGPGHYESLPKLATTGKYFISGMKNAQTTVISPAKSDRFLYNSNEKNPGPGNYNYEQFTGLSPVGKYFVSNLHNSKCRTFGKAILRSSSNENNNVGPGLYQMSSEFGIYEARKRN